MKNVLWIEGNRVQNIYTPHDEICLDIREYFASGLYAVRETRYDGIILNPRTPFMRGTDVPELLDVEEDPGVCGVGTLARYSSTDQPTLPES